MKCEHEKERTRCRECNGPGEGSFCLHGIIRGTCSSCEPEKVFARYQRQAQERGIKFELNLEQFKRIVFQSCHWCNKYGLPRGIDRRCNFENYTVKNSLPCCARCNRWKSNETEYTFLGHAQDIVWHQEQLRLKSEIDRGGIAGVVPAPSPVDSINDNL